MAAGSARATVGRLVLFGERFGESDAKICATHRANCELSRTTPSLRMVKSAGSNTIAFTKSSIARSTFGRCGRTQPSTSAHADFAAVNVNFWITPDEANLDSKTGGMIVYDLEVPPIGASNATIHKRTKSALSSKKGMPLPPTPRTSPIGLSYSIQIFFIQRRPSIFAKATKTGGSMSRCCLDDVKQTLVITSETGHRGSTKQNLP
jgi:hypothetical protein